MVILQRRLGLEGWRDGTFDDGSRAASSAACGNGIARLCGGAEGAAGRRCGSSRLWLPGCLQRARPRSKSPPERRVGRADPPQSACPVPEVRQHHCPSGLGHPRHRPTRKATHKGRITGFAADPPIRGRPAPCGSVIKTDRLFLLRDRLAGPRRPRLSSLHCYRVGGPTGGPPRPR
jgi:hypothetical protein